MCGSCHPVFHMRSYAFYSSVDTSVFLLKKTPFFKCPLELHELVQLHVAAGLVSLLLARLASLFFFLHFCFMAVDFMIDPVQLGMFPSMMIWSSLEWAESPDCAINS